MLKSLIVLFVIFASCLVLAACASHNNAYNSVLKYQPIILGDYTLQSTIPKKIIKNEVVIVIEGDGYNEIINGSLEADLYVTVALDYVQNYATGNTVYLGRPCQNYGGKSCLRPKGGGVSRYTEQKVSALNDAVGVIKLNTGASAVRLVGYSGGATMALLIANLRVSQGLNDVSGIITLAGNLDHLATQLWHIEKFGGATLGAGVNPIDILDTINHIPVIHYMGAKDEVVPARLSRKFIEKSNKDCAVVVNLQKATHHENWREYFPAISSRVPTCSQDVASL
jgi:predicted esterase